MDEEKYLGALDSYGLDWEERWPAFYRTQYWYLFTGLYLNHKKNGPLKSITDCRKLLRKRGEDISDPTCDTYLEKAENSNIIRIDKIDGAKDKRKKQVIPTEDFLKDMEIHLSETARRFRKAMQDETPRK